MRLLVLALLLGVPVLAADAFAAPAIPVVDPPASVRAGETYETAVPDLPLEVEEFELFLCPEDGSQRLIRLTREHDAGESVLRWRMPRIAAASARLVMRAGGRFGETESAPSEPFVVERSPGLELPELLRGEDETAWRLRSSAAVPEALRLPPGAASLATSVGAVAAAVPGRDSGTQPPSRLRPVAGRCVPAALDRPTSTPESRRPARVALRI